MAFPYFNPQRAMHQLRNEVNRLLTDFGVDGGSSWPLTGRGQPALNLWETPDALMLEAELPGIRSEQLEISVVGPELTLKVHRPESEPQDTVYHRRERPVGTFTRVVRLPVVVEADKVAAELRNGVLTVTLPKAEVAKPRKIQVTSA